jgi:uncharacterized membrane protein YciS (DUF1049 family)
MKYFTYILWLLFLLVVVVFVSVNSQPITLNYYISKVHIILPLLMLIVLFVGFIAFFCAFLPLWLRMKKRNMKLNKKVKSLETEINNLRIMPIKGIVE